MSELISQLNCWMLHSLIQKRQMNQMTVMQIVKCCAVVWSIKSIISNHADYNLPVLLHCELLQLHF